MICKCHVDPRRGCRCRWKSPLFQSNGKLWNFQLSCISSCTIFLNLWIVKNYYNSTCPYCTTIMKPPLTLEIISYAFFVFKANNLITPFTPSRYAFPLFAVDSTNQPTSIYHAPLCVQNSVRGQGRKRKQKRTWSLSSRNNLKSSCPVKSVLPKTSAGLHSAVGQPRNIY